MYQDRGTRLCKVYAANSPRLSEEGDSPLNANDANLTELTTAQSGSTVEDNAPNAPAQPGFDLVVEAVAGNAIGNGGAPYTLTVTAMDLTPVAPAPAPNPPTPNPHPFALP